MPFFSGNKICSNSFTHSFIYIRCFATKALTHKAWKQKSIVWTKKINFNIFLNETVATRNMGISLFESFLGNEALDNFISIIFAFTTTCAFFPGFCAMGKHLPLLPTELVPGPWPLAEKTFPCLRPLAMGSGEQSLLLVFLTNGSYCFIEWLNFFQIFFSFSWFPPFLFPASNPLLETAAVFSKDFCNSWIHQLLQNQNKKPGDTRRAREQNGTTAVKIPRGNRNKYWGGKQCEKNKSKYIWN